MKLKSSPSEAPCRRMRWASSNSEFLFNSKFPRCNHCGHHVRFVLVRGAIHIDSHEHFKK